MNERPDPAKFIPVETTLPTTPLPSNASRGRITTERLLLRPLEATDLDRVHALRQQEDVMKWTSEGRIDADLAESRDKLAQFLPPNDKTSMLYAICSKQTGDFIGMGGLITLEANLGWPAISYLFGKETWGQGYATEFLRAFLPVYCSLPRSQVTVNVDPRTVTGLNEAEEERLTANTVGSNDKSQKVLEKCGFERVLLWQGRRCAMSSFEYFPLRNSPAGT